MALTHFNMATFVRNGDPACDAENCTISSRYSQLTRALGNKDKNSSNPDVFNPVKLNISNWIESYNALGAKHAVLTAKHGCGFLLWNTSTVLPDGKEYGYGVQRRTIPSFSRNVLQEFSDAMEKAGLGHGFYYSTGCVDYFQRSVLIFAATTFI